MIHKKIQAIDLTDEVSGKEWGRDEGKGKELHRGREEKWKGKR